MATGRDAIRADGRSPFKRPALLHQAFNFLETAMLLISCPFCGEREETEFHCGGEAHIERPRQPAALSDDEWADYLFMRTNPKGVHVERWRHLHGCGRWFNVARDTVSDRILAVYPMGTPAPAVALPARSPAQASTPRLRVVESEREEQP